MVNRDWNFFGNPAAVEALAGMIARNRVQQTLLIVGPEGVGKATLARRFGAALLGDERNKIEQDDLSLAANQSVIAEREKWTADKRNEQPLVFGTHPDFLTFPPDGPLRQITIQQMRLLKERAPLKPLQGNWRVVLIDGMERANAQAANSLLKTLEEPPPHLVLIMTARNPYDLLPTIRSRAVTVALGPLAEPDMHEFLGHIQASTPLKDAGRRVALAAGAPGMVVSLDLEAYDRRRTAMLALLGVAAGMEPFGSWLKHSDSIAARRTEKLESYLEVLYGLVQDVIYLRHGGEARRNRDISLDLSVFAERVSFDWLRRVVARADQLLELGRRNIQKPLAFDALAVELRPR